MPRAFLVKPRSLEQVPVTSQSSRDASSLLPVDSDVNNNDVSRSSSTLFRPVDMTTSRPADDVVWSPLDVARGPSLWWSMLRSASSQPGPRSWRGSSHGGQVRDITSPAEHLPSMAAATSESGTAADDDAQHPWWTASPHSDVSASGMKSFISVTRLKHDAALRYNYSFGSGFFAEIFSCF